MGQLTQQEFAALLDEAQPRLWTLAAAIIGDRVRAEDVVQDAAITGLRRLADFDRDTNFFAWISQIVRYTALNCRSTESHRKAASLEVHPVSSELAEDVLEAEADTVVSPSGRLLADQQAFDDRIAAALEGLEPERRACLLLRTIHHLTYDEIAESVGVPVGTAMSHVHRAKATLRHAVAGQQTGGGADHG